MYDMEIMIRNFHFPYHLKKQPRESLENLQISGEAKWRDYGIQQFENGTIRVLISNTVQQTAMQHLRDIASETGVSILNNNSQLKNLRQLRAEIIKVLQVRTEKFEL